MKKKRILSGMRPTGRLHLGNLVGALENWVSLQSDYESFHLIADYHALTTSLDTSHIYNNSIETLIDWLSVGIDHRKSPLFRQSQIKEHTELHLIFSMLVTKARLERNPTLKDQIRDLDIENVTYGHLGYPVLQSSDILLYKGELVPVGEDQVPHVEITREIARRFNQQWGKVFPEPEAKLTKIPRLPGIDGDMKMSKSAGNTILLSDSPDTIGERMKKAVTDPKKIRKGDPGRPEICLVFTYHKKFNETEISQIETDCRSGDLGCVECKKRIGKRIAEYLEPVRSKRAYYESHSAEVKEILNDGETRARSVAQETMQDVRAAMKMG